MLFRRVLISREQAGQYIPVLSRAHLCFDALSTKCCFITGSAFVSPVRRDSSPTVVVWETISVHRVLVLGYVPEQQRYTVMADLNRIRTTAPPGTVGADPRPSGFARYSTLAAAPVAVVIDQVVPR